MPPSPETFLPAVTAALHPFATARAALCPGLVARESGVVRTVSTGLATVTGLPGAEYEELLQFEGGLTGFVFNLNEKLVDVVLLGDDSTLRVGARVERTGRVTDVSVGFELLGRVIDPMGRPRDGRRPPAATRRLPIERDAPAILDRSPVSEPLQTGLKVVDALVPIGRGQRELILGDRQTGKSAITVDTILNQRGQGVLCVYCAIGQRASSVAKVVARLREQGAMDYTVVLVAEGNDSPGVRFVAPYAATSIAEYFAGQGRDALIVYDDLTQHARAYREISLLLRRPPGREAFPGDVFFIHSRLLERSTRLLPEDGGGSLTALPIVETESGDVSAYIPTNLISITDGQICLSSSLFEKGILPAVDVGRSVSRVGGKAQRAACRALAGPLKLAYAQFEELEAFTRFGARLDESSRRVIERGRRIRACLNQPQYVPAPLVEQILVLSALNAGLFDGVPVGQMAAAESAVRQVASGLDSSLTGRLRRGEEFSPSDRDALISAARTAAAPFTEQKAQTPTPP